MAETLARRREEGRRIPKTVYIDAAIWQAIERAAEADRVAPGVLARAALERGLPGEIEARRKRRGREAGRERGQDPQ
ncbi:MAG: hypothetical protein OXG99_13500 [Alphaproteobacteria bacterium]|nr:hypothetical protein [Alphaproteobacteria bacterium]